MREAVSFARQQLLTSSEVKKLGGDVVLYSEGYVAHRPHL